MIKQSGFAPSELNREQPTLATAVQLCPTPAACNPQDGEELQTWLARRELIKAQKKNGNGMGTPLAIAVQMWPTAQARDWKGPSGRSIKGTERDLPMAVQIWPTPAARDWRDNGTEPAAQDRKSPNIAAIVMRVSHPDQINRSSIGKNRARLNPRWVAQLMGFPADWLDGVEEPSKG